MGIIYKYLLIASEVVSTTYGYGEGNCGDVIPRPCTYGAVTASGMVFDPNEATVAIAVPRQLRVRAQRIGLRMPGDNCVEVILNDKMNERWIGTRGFDLSPAAVAKVTGSSPSPSWSGRLEYCKVSYTDEELEWSNLYTVWPIIWRESWRKLYSQ